VLKITGEYEYSSSKKTQCSRILLSALGTTPDFWMKLHFGNEIWEIENSKIDLPEKISA